MAIQKIPIEQFLLLAQAHAVLDVRSPGEFNHARIPGAYNLPLFSDEERKVVGTAYKQQNRETAVKIGLDYFGPKMRGIVEEAERISDRLADNIKSAKEESFDTEKLATRNSPPVSILLHCWRGGMRSAGVAWLLDLYGFKAYTLAGGYKAYRNWVLTQFKREYNFKIIGGYTGSGKTVLLHALARQGYHIIDLEALANHKGSALGSMGPQPEQEMFENMLAAELYKNADKEIFLEDESQRIGDRQIPMDLWHTMRKSPVYFFEIPFEARLDYLTQEYGSIAKEKLVNAVVRIQKRLGGLEAKNAIGFLLENNYRECFRILLKYYDKYYGKALQNRTNAAELITVMAAETVDDNNVMLLEKELK